MRLPMVAGQLKDADWEQDITCDRCVAKDRVVDSRSGYRARADGICCVAMNARNPRAGLESGHISYGHAAGVTGWLFAYRSTALACAALISAEASLSNKNPSETARAAALETAAT